MGKGTTRWTSQSHLQNRVTILTGACRQGFTIQAIMLEQHTPSYVWNRRWSKKTSVTRVSKGNTRSGYSCVKREHTVTTKWTTKQQQAVTPWQAVTPCPHCVPLSSGRLPLLEPWQQLPAYGHGNRCTIVAGCNEPSVQKAREVSRSYQQLHQQLQQ